MALPRGSPSPLRVVLASLAAAAVLPAASATIVTDHGFKCIFNANGVTASATQRGPNVSDFSTTVSRTLPKKGKAFAPNRGQTTLLPSPASFSQP